MDADDLHPLDDYSHRFFIWHEWIQANGPLTSENVFDYFATSMFYDKQSNNQVLRMQTMHTGQPIANEAEELKRFTGVEFAVVHAQPPSLFIIHKRERLSPEEVRPLAAYFIMNNRIYQSPDLYTVLSNRMLTTLHSLQTSLDILRENRPDFTPRTGFVWPIVAPSNGALTKKKSMEDIASHDATLGELSGQATSTTTTKKSDTPASSRKQQNIIPLLNAMRVTNAHSAASFISHTSEDMPLEASQELSQSSGTSVPREETPVVHKPSVPQDSSATSSRPSIAGGRKKRKRTSNAAGGTT